MNPLLLAAFAYSKKIKSDRDQRRAVAAQRAKSKITNFAFGDNGIRVLGENDKLKSDEKLYGFRIGDGDTINNTLQSQHNLLICTKILLEEIL